MRHIHGVTNSGADVVCRRDVRSRFEGWMRHIHGVTNSGADVVCRRDVVQALPTCGVRCMRAVDN